MYSVDLNVYDDDKLIATTDSNGDVIFTDYSSYGATERYLEPGTTIIRKRNVLDYLESRCPQRDRVDIKRLLSEMGLETYDPVKIIQHTEGIMFPLDTVKIEIKNVVGERKWDF